MRSLSQNLFHLASLLHITLVVGRPHLLQLRDLDVRDPFPSDAPHEDPRLLLYVRDANAEAESYPLLPYDPVKPELSTRPGQGLEVPQVPQQQPNTQTQTPAQQSGQGRPALQAPAGNSCGPGGCDPANRQTIGQFDQWTQGQLSRTPIYQCTNCGKYPPIKKRSVGSKVLLYARDANAEAEPYPLLPYDPVKPELSTRPGQGLEVPQVSQQQLHPQAQTLQQPPTQEHPPEQEQRPTPGSCGPGGCSPANMQIIGYRVSTPGSNPNAPGVGAPMTRCTNCGTSNYFGKRSRIDDVISMLRGLSL